MHQFHTENKLLRTPLSSIDLWDKFLWPVLMKSK